MTLAAATSIENMGRLATLVKHLRTLGIVQYSMGDLTLSVLPDEPAPDFVPELPPKAGVEVEEETKVRHDGLTAEDQMELYGRTMS
jgi:hypothetical protein